MSYQERREQLMKQLPEYGIALLYSGQAPYSVGDEKYPFSVDRSFYYYTGIDRENLWLVLFALPGQPRVMLYLEPFDPVMAKWVGGKILPEEARQISGIDDIRYVGQLQDDLGGLINRYGTSHEITLAADLTRQYLTQPSAASDLIDTLRTHRPEVKVVNLFAAIFRQRSVKQEEEIEAMGRAIAVTNEGIKAMMTAAREGIWENELEAYFDFVLKSEQCGHAFATICASGKNATVLHYSANNCRSQPGDLVLCDLGASYQYYNADITRTFPIAGTFTPRQREVYEVVLAANKMIMAEARPGVTTRELNNKVIEFYQNELPKIGLLKDGETVRDYYWHGVSHMIGLETHDIQLFDEPLAAGNVISDEPGLYLEKEGIGIRIEDDLLITETGCVDLSKDIIKEPDDIEAFMRGHH